MQQTGPVRTYVIRAPGAKMTVVNTNLLKIFVAAVLDTGHGNGTRDTGQHTTLRDGGRVRGDGQVRPGGCPPLRPHRRRHLHQRRRALLRNLRTQGMDIDKRQTTGGCGVGRGGLCVSLRFCFLRFHVDDVLFRDARRATLSLFREE